MKKILFPTDFSKTADNAFLYALSLAQKLNAEVNLLHVYELPELGRALKNTTKEVYEMMEMEALEEFKASIKKLRALAEDSGFGSIPLKQDMVEGETVYRVAQAAEKCGADLIVMGTKGATGLKEVFLGSVATGVIDDSKIPVLTIPFQTNFKNTIDKIAYLSNYKKEEVEAFQKVGEFAKLFGANVLCVHYDGQEEVVNGDRESWKKELNLSGATIDFNVITGDDFEEALIEFNKTQQIDILAVQPRKKNIFARLFTKSVSKSIAHHLNIPLLTLPKK